MVSVPGVRVSSVVWVSAQSGGDERLQAVLAQLRAREPLFHQRHLTSTAEDVEGETAEDFWETGASGRRYTREFVRDDLARRYASEVVDESVREGWTTRDFRMREIPPNTYLLTYTLHGQGRVTRRVSVWQGSVLEGWTVLYHQGTVVADPDSE